MTTLTMPVHNVSNRRWSRPSPRLLCRRWSHPAPCLLHCCWSCLASLFLQLLPVPHLHLCWLLSAPLLRLWWLRQPIQFRLFQLPSAPLSHELPAQLWPSRPASVTLCLWPLDSAQVSSSHSSTVPLVPPGLTAEAPPWLLPLSVLRRTFIMARIWVGAWLLPPSLLLCPYLGCSVAPPWTLTHIPRWSLPPASSTIDLFLFPSPSFTTVLLK